LTYKESTWWILRKEGQNLDQLGSAIRLANRLDKIHLNPEQIESFLDKIDEHCVKKGTEIVVFIKHVADVCSLSSKTRTTVEKLPSHIKDMKAEISSLSMEIILKKVEREKALHIHNITEMQLREFAMNKPVFEGLQTTERNLAIVPAQRNAACMEICRLRTRLDFEEYAIALRKLNDTKDDKCRS
jgi:hypothetical protein